ncbi:MAG TPA: ABC transporter permease subunit [Acidimicrobiales bacterium]|nr:ABC transporter permease subunit [Acidimicrobiales bacterium]
MQADLALDRRAAAGRSPSTVVARQTARKAVRSGVLWGYVFGLYLATQALAYATSYKTVVQRVRLAKEFESNAGVSALVGPAHEIQTVAGFTVWKCLAVLTIVGAVWGLLAGTRLLRGEEEAGRWELLLAGQTTRRAAAAQALAGLAAGVAALWAVTALITAVVGRSSKVDFSVGGALFLAVAVVSGAAMFLAVGALASQFAATRRQAAAYGGAALGVSYAIRMVADSGTGLDWLRWASPLGWVEQLQPLTAPEPLALLPIAAFIVVLAGVTVHLAGARDLGASTLPDRASSRPRTRLLSGPTGLNIRLMRGSVATWGAAIAAYSLLLGLVAKSAGSAISSSPSLVKVFERLGAGAGADAYLGVVFLIIAVSVAFIAVGQISAARAEEATGRLEHLLVRPVSRTSWLVGRLVAAAVVLLAGGVIAGVFSWLGAASQHAGVSFTRLLEAGLNIVPPVVCILGIGGFVIGILPRAAVVATYGVLVWSFLVELVGGIVNVNHWVLDTSVFHQMAAAPAVSANWATGGVMVAVGAVASALGVIAFRRRDLQGE